MTTSIQLLGRPAIRCDGRPVEMKGRKAWAVLGYLLLSERPVPRPEVAELLFAQADDPMRVLRWNLTELRRALNITDLFREERDLVVGLPEGTLVDIEVLASTKPLDAVTIQGIGRELLEGVDVAGAPAFEAWLLNKRRQFRALSSALLREAALVHLGRDDPESAVDTAVRLVALDPLDEAAQATLIRAYVAAGDHASATRQLAACVSLLRTELGVEAGPLVIEAIRDRDPSRRWTRHGRPTAVAQLEAGQAAIRGGALEAGLDCLRRARIEARSCSDPTLEMQALLAIGSTFAHRFGVGLQDEGITGLHQAIDLAARLGDEVAEGQACYELAWIEFLSGRYDRCFYWADRAPAALNDHSVLASIGYVRGKALTETGRYSHADSELRRALPRARASQDPLRAAMVLTALGRGSMLRGQMDLALPYLEEGTELVSTHHLTWYAPCTEAFLGETYRSLGQIDRGTSVLDHAIAMAQENRDATGEILALRGRCLIDAAAGEVGRSVDTLRRAIEALIREPEYAWALAWGIDSLCRILVEHHPEEARPWVDRLERMAGGTGMRELLVHAYLHKHRLGDEEALASAAVLSQGIDNPLLEGGIAAAGAGAHPERIV